MTEINNDCHHLDNVVKHELHSRGRAYRRKFLKTRLLKYLALYLNTVLNSVKEEVIADGAYLATAIFKHVGDEINDLNNVSFAYKDGSITVRYLIKPAVSSFGYELPSVFFVTNGVNCDANTSISAGSLSIKDIKEEIESLAQRSRELTVLLDNIEKHRS